MPTPAGPPAAPDLASVFPGDSEMARRCRAHDWAATPLGSVAGWPQSLRTVVSLCLAAPGPMCLSWGPELALVYNDAYRAVLGAAKHPGALGCPTRAVWAEVWDQIAPDFARAMAGGPATAHEDQRFVLHRGGRDEEAFFSYAFVPVRDEAGRVGGGLHVLTETTGRVRAEAALRAERERLRALVLQMPTPVALHKGPELRFALVNVAYKRASGGGRDVTGLTPREAFPELAGQGCHELLDRVYATGEPWLGPETPVRYDRDGTGVQDTWFTLRYEPVRDGGANGVPGRVTGVLQLAVDVTEQVRARRQLEGVLAESEAARAALAASEARFRTVQDASPLGFCIHRPIRDAGGAVVDFVTPYINAAGARIVGQPPERVMTERLLVIWPSAGDEGIVADYARVLETGVSNVRELLYEHDELAAGLTLTAVRIGDGADAELGITFTDVTARLRAERERERLLAETEAARAAADLERRRLLATPDQLPVGVHVAEAPSGRLVLDNAALRRIVGAAPASERIADYSADYAGYRPGPEPEAERRLASEAWPLARALATGAPVADELVEVRRADGTRRLVRISATPVRDADGRVVGGVAAVADVTEREHLLAAARAATEAERAARAEAEAANRAKGEFLAVMSHELRTPLNAIGGYAELIELGIHGPVTPEQRTALARIQVSQRHLLGLIAGVLDYSRVEAGAVTYRITEVPIVDALAEAELLVAPQLRAKGLGYAWSGAAPGLAVRADREKLQQILLNLLSNAVKFTDARGGVPGRIEVSCAAEAAGDGNPDIRNVAVGGVAGGAPGGGRVQIRVRDTGAGIAADAIERVFEPFVQADQRLTRPHAGVGLGLAISRDLARGMGGDLTAESTPGVGSTFTLTLPAA